MVNFPQVVDFTFSITFIQSIQTPGALVFDPLELLQFIYGDSLQKASIKFRNRSGAELQTVMPS
jgi:hypothetical protein